MPHNEQDTAAKNRRGAYKGFRGDTADDIRQMEDESGAPFGSNEFAAFFGFPLPHPTGGAQFSPIPAKPALPVRGGVTPVTPPTGTTSPIAPGEITPGGTGYWELYDSSGTLVAQTYDATVAAQWARDGGEARETQPPPGQPPQINPDDPTFPDEGFGPPVFPPGALVPTAPVLPVVPFEGDPTTFGRFTQFLNARGLGATGGGPAGAFGRGLFGQTQNLFDLQDKARGLFNTPDQFGPQLPAPSFTDFLANQGGGARGLRSGAADLLSRILGVGADERTARGFGFGNEFDAEGLQVTGADREGLSISDQNAFLEAGLRQQFGRLGGAHIAGRLGTERNIFSQRQAQGTATAPSFLDFLRAKYGIR